MKRLLSYFSLAILAVAQTPSTTVLGTRSTVGPVTTGDPATSRTNLGLGGSAVKDASGLGAVVATMDGSFPENAVPIVNADGTQVPSGCIISDSIISCGAGSVPSRIGITKGTAPTDTVIDGVTYDAVTYLDTADDTLKVLRNSGPAVSISNHGFGATFIGTLTSGTTPGTSLVILPPLDTACVAKNWTLTVDAGTAGVRLWRAAAGTAIPTVGGTLNTGDLAISTGTNLVSSSFSNFTGSAAPTFAVGDIVAVQLNAVSTATYVAFSLRCR